MATQLECELFVPDQGSRSVVWQLEGNGPWAVGRFACDVEVVHSSVSKRHFLIASVGAEAVQIRKLSNTNDVRIEGESIQQGPWSVGQTLYFGLCAVRLTAIRVPQVAEVKALRATAAQAKPMSLARSPSSESVAKRVSKLTKITKSTEVKFQRFLLLSLLIVAAGSFVVLRSNQKKMNAYTELQNSVSELGVVFQDCRVAQELWTNTGTSLDELKKRLGETTGKISRMKSIVQQYPPSSSYGQDPSFQELLLQLSFQLEQGQALEQCLKSFLARSGAGP